MTLTQSLPVLDAVRRELEIDTRTSHEGHPHVQVVLTLTTNLSLAPAQVWPLITDPHELAQWFGPVRGELSEGSGFESPGVGASPVEGTVVEIAEPHRLLVDWRQPGAEGPLLVRLDPEDDGTTRLRLRHSAVMDAADFARRGAAALAIGWEIALLALAAQTGGWATTCLEPVPTPTPAWLSSVEGAEHRRAWAVRWTAEAIAAGMDEQVARNAESIAIAETAEV
ncbi:SRPBCC domain-containing protein [Brachybacterium sp. Marseille-Q7125]|uniref:SRPBCC domain-containing protein n=1 Tax=Brachybacterium sp. Marseille-Q7125 TaxID=2932815 RepID=UPI001FF287BA|nr:SRPBCC domain-containing protein [Brachybacterium sp. Marseille-Q7125]